MTDDRVPDETLAAELVLAATGLEPVSVSRFPAGITHYVYDVHFEARPSVVIRIAAADRRADMVAAGKLNRLLRPLGVPLPSLHADRSAHAISHLILTRLPGTDLGNVADTLGDASLAFIAGRVHAAQMVVANLPTAGRYGYAATADAAPHATWSAVIEAHLRRSGQRIVAARLFDIASVTRAAQGAARLRGALDAHPATPFLHDATNKNVIVTEDGQFSGIVDVDDLCYGDPRFAAALTLAAMIAFGGPTRYVALWMRAAGWADDAVFQLYVVVFLLDFMSEHGQTFNGNQRPSDPVARDALAGHFAQAIADLESRL